MAKFYVVQKSNWQGDDWKPIAGPFPTKPTAEAELPNYEYHPHKETGGIDLAEQRHAKVVSRTWLARHGYPTKKMGEARLLGDICSNRENWMDFIGD